MKRTMIELTFEQHMLATTDPEAPTRVLDPVSKEVFVLLPEKTYESVCQQVLAESHGDVDVGLLVDDAMKEYDSDDPLLDSYQSMKG
jgi:hypothetical protein